ncbi:putative iron reductase domain protein [Daldinia loculata]|uniref:putative iron reductase domain protein n=1 Tax=Daldinia loculata TaxID=103429 RepID=UPI0020C40A55|nr:putative iron reductase domain protein [Daldinia loculata]KAI1645206.1 putative iron reductase domain protein [Daldinia loculata]KAI2780068.1 putative iron reductase domain protein [Daldinia loculata]
MGFISRIATAVTLLVGHGLTAPVSASAKYCDESTGVCYSEISIGVAPIVWRIAIPEVTEGPFDILLQIVAPKSVGWAGIAWGGGMLYNPISLGWANGNSTVPAARFATAHVQPEIYESANHTTLQGSTANATHWTLTTLCQGCSTWIHNGGAKETLDPGATAASFAFAASATPPIDPTDPSSPIGIHSEHGIFTLDLAAAKSAQFNSWVEKLGVKR